MLMRAELVIPSFSITSATMQVASTTNLQQVKSAPTMEVPPRALGTLLPSIEVQQARIRICYHVYARAGRLWEGIVRDQMHKILFSGLYHAATTIHCYISGPEAELARAVLLDFGAKISIEAADVDDVTYERLALLGVRKHVQPDDRVLYLHSKGVTRIDSKQFAYQHVEDWRSYMEYFLLARWRDCIQHLQRWDAVGVNRKVEPKPHFSGNFWWCTGEHLLRLPDTIGNKYLDPEMYVLSIPTTRSFCVLESNVFQYGTPFPARMYVDHIAEGSEGNCGSTNMPPSPSPPSAPP